MSAPFHTSIGLRGRVTVPGDIQAAAGLGVGDPVVVRAAGPGVVVIETPRAAKERRAAEGALDGEETGREDPAGQ